MSAAGQRPYFLSSLAAFDWPASGLTASKEEGDILLKAIRDELEGGWLFSVKELITSKVSADFLEMSSYLLEQGYKDPVAVIAGTVLERYLRQLRAANRIDIELQ